MGWDFSQVDVSQNVSNQSLDAAEVLDKGWYKLQLVEIGETKETTSGTAEGGNWKFEVVDGSSKGVSFSTWQASRAISDKAAFMVKRTLLFVQRLAQVVGVPQVYDPSVLLNKPFWALVDVEEREYRSNKDVDLVTGERALVKSKNNRFAKGNLGDILMSCAEYAQKYGAQKSQADFEFSFNPNAPITRF